MSQRGLEIKFKLRIVYGLIGPLRQLRGDKFEKLHGYSKVWNTSWRVDEDGDDDDGDNNNDDSDDKDDDERQINTLEAHGLRHDHK